MLDHPAQARDHRGNIIAIIAKAVGDQQHGHIIIDLADDRDEIGDKTRNEDIDQAKDSQQGNDDILAAAFSCRFNLILGRRCGIVTYSPCLKAGASAVNAGCRAYARSSSD